MATICRYVKHFNLSSFFLELLKQEKSILILTILVAEK